MSSKTEIDPFEAFKEHFRDLDYKRQSKIIDDLKDAFQTKLDSEKERLRAELAELDKLDGVAPNPPPAPIKGQAEGGHGKGGKREIQFWSRRNPEKGVAGNGRPSGWMVEEMQAFGLTRDDFRIKRKHPQYFRDQEDRPLTVEERERIK